MIAGGVYLIDLSGGKLDTTSQIVREYTDESTVYWLLGAGVSYSYGYSSSESDQHFEDYFIIGPGYEHSYLTDMWDDGP